MMPERPVRTILITGAAGHIGSRFVHSLVPGQFDEVRLMTRRPAHTYPSMVGLPENVPFRFIQCDIFDSAFASHLADVDAVVHLSAMTDAEASLAAPRDTEHINREGSLRVAEACLEHGCRLFFPSTTSLYGGWNRVMTEDGPEDQIRPQSPYARSKLEAEQGLRSLGERGLRYCVCRFATVFGPAVGMRFHTAINKFVWQAASGRPLTIWRTAMGQTRPYLDVADAVAVIDFLLREDRFENQVYNGATVNTTVRKILEILRARVPDLNLAYVDSPIMNDFSYEVSTEKLKNLGFAFRGDLAGTIDETLAAIARDRDEQSS
jgi:UDP-glucose 4-epimerase